MFSSALKSISATNITSNYSISANSTSTAGPWKIYDAKKKSTGKPYSVFVFDRKSLDSNAGSLSRSSASAFKRTADEVVDRLKREASALARLRHPSVLELVEPVEDTRGGGLQFVTEPVTASLASLLQDKDDQERSGGPGGRSSRYVTEDSDGTRRRREIEIDELEIQKGLLQISKALEFLHENAGLVHGNLTPDAILVNAKSDWKISGLSYCSPPEGSTKPTSFQPISLSEVLNPDPRLPRFVQINLDYTSPDFVMDHNLTTSADLFSLGILSVALYNSPHRSPIESNQSLSSYKRVFASSSTTPSANNNFCSSRPLPRELSQQVLPRLITRRPAQRMTAKEFQMSEYFDNILVSTIRFLDSFPAKTPNEKAQFMRGLNKVLPSFPKSVMEKKILPALMEEMKDKDLVSLILQNVFRIIDLLPSGRRAFGDRVRAKLKELFVTNVKNAQEKEPARDAGLMVVLENLATIAGICGGKEFKDDILPIIGTALESPTPSVVDAALRSLPVMLPVLDFSTIKNELFPVIATIFSRTNSLAIKVRGLQAFAILCGGSSDSNDDDGLDGLNGLNGRKAKSTSSSALDKYTMQEKIVPLVKVIKTKEPAVMIAALNVMRVVGKVADAEFVAMEILPILWNMSLGPLLDLKQFQSFMDLIRTLSKRVEDEQMKKLQELSGTSNGGTTGPNDDFMSFGGVTGTQFEATTNGGDDDFESLVKGKASGSSTTANQTDAVWDGMGTASAMVSPGIRPSVKSPSAPTFSWSTPNNSTPSLPTAARAQASSFRTVTPDLGNFQSLAPSNTQFSQPLQPQSASAPPPPASSTPNPSSSGTINWSTAPAASSSPWASSSTSSHPISPPTSSFGGGLNSSMSSMSVSSRPGVSQQSPSFSLPPPPAGNSSFGGSGGGVGSGMSSFSLAPPPSASTPQQTAGPKYGSGLSLGGTSQGTGMGMGGMGMANNNSMNQNSGSGMGMGMGMGMAAMMAQQQQKQQTAIQPPPQGTSGSGLDRFQSLL